MGTSKKFLVSIILFDHHQIINGVNPFHFIYLTYSIKTAKIEAMDDLYELLFDKGRVGNVLGRIQKQGVPNPTSDPRTLLYGHALNFLGNFKQAQEIFSAVPRGGPREAERLWGLAQALLMQGDLKPVPPLLDDAFGKNPPPWLCARIFHTLANLHLNQGQPEKAYQAIDQGVAQAQRYSCFTEWWLLESFRGIVKINQGAMEEAILVLQRAAKHLLERDSPFHAVQALNNLGHTFAFLGDLSEARKCLTKAEHFVQETGAKSVSPFLPGLKADLLAREGRIDQAGTIYREGLDLLQELPNPILEAQLACNLANIYFEKGETPKALQIVRQTMDRLRAKGVRVNEDLFLCTEGKFLLLSGQEEEGMAILHRADELSLAMKRTITHSFISLYLALGYEQGNRRSQALQSLNASLEAAERCQILASFVERKDLLVPLLLKLGEALPDSGFLYKLTIQLGHPALLKRILRRSPEAKILFLDSLEAHQAKPFRPLLEKLTKDPQKEVRRRASRLLQGWQQHTGYRVTSLGTFGVWLDRKLFTDRDWFRPGAKRLFLFLLTHPGKWHATDVLLETLWNKPHPGKARHVLTTLFLYLRELFEPWHLPRKDYVFFQSQRGAYGFFPGERFRIDAEEFQEAVKEGEHAQLSRKLQEARKAYRRALDLYLGDYLEEFPYEDWLNPRRDHLREAYFRATLKYATLERDSGNLPEARRVLEEALFKDLSRAECVTPLIQVLSRMKLPQLARDWGQRHLRYMKEELDEAPASKILEALNRLP